MVAQACRETNGRGVVTVRTQNAETDFDTKVCSMNPAMGRTPSGLGEREWDRGLAMYASAGR